MVGSCKVTCNYHGPRKYTEKDVARIICHAVGQGRSWESIKELVEDECQLESVKAKCDCAYITSKVSHLLEVALIALNVLLLVNPVLRALKWASVYVPGALQLLRQNMKDEDFIALSPKNIVEKKQLMDDSQSFIEGEWKKIVDDPKIFAGVVIKEPL